MADFSVLIEDKMKEEKSRLSESRKILAHAPEGYLRVRNRRGQNVYYISYNENGTRHDVNIGSRSFDITSSADWQNRNCSYN